jgi:hypothetical protein
MTPTQTAAEMENVTAKAMISHIADAPRLRLGSMIEAAIVVCRQSRGWPYRYVNR